MFALAKLTFPGGEGGPRKRWMRGTDGAALFAPHRITSSFIQKQS